MKQIGLAWPGLDLAIESVEIETHNMRKSIELLLALCPAAQWNNGSVARLPL